MPCHESVDLSHAIGVHHVHSDQSNDDGHKLQVYACDHPFLFSYFLEKVTAAASSRRTMKSMPIPPPPLSVGVGGFGGSGGSGGFGGFGGFGVGLLLGTDGDWAGRSVSTYGMSPLTGMSVTYLLT